MLVNFRNLTAQRARKTRTKNTAVPVRGGRPRPATPSRPARTVRPAHRLHTRRIATAVDAEAAFTRMYAASPRAFWLDSARVEEGGHGSRSSVTAPGRCRSSSGTTSRAAAARSSGPAGPRARSGRASSTTSSGSWRTAAWTPPGCPSTSPADTSATSGTRPRPTAAPRTATGPKPRRLLAVRRPPDRRGPPGRLHLRRLCGRGHPQATREATDWLDGALAQLTFVGPEPQPLPPAPVSAEPDLDAAEPWLVRDRSTYLADIEACTRELRAGTSYEICLTNAARLPAPPDAYDFYRVLRRVNPAPYAAFLRFGDLDVAGASPSASCGSPAAASPRPGPSRAPRPGAAPRRRTHACGTRWPPTPRPAPRT